MVRPEKPSSVYLDTNALVYAITDKPAGKPVAEILRLAQAGKITVYVSVLSYVEVRGYSNSDPYPPERDRRCIELLDSAHLIRVEFARRVALRARRFAHQYRLKNFDAMHLASAVEADVDVFMSADKGFPHGQLIEGVWLDEPYEPGDPSLFSN